MPAYLSVLCGTGRLRCRLAAISEQCLPQLRSALVRVGECRCCNLLRVWLLLSACGIPLRGDYARVPCWR